MCGRYNILSDVDALMDTFEILQSDVQVEPFEPRYNISPSTRNLIVTTGDENRLTRVPIIRPASDLRRHLKSAVWPLIPVWANAQVPKYATANARSETMTQRVSFRNAWKRSQRCLIPATGFYEWQTVPGDNPKQPWHIYHREQSVMCFAGLWEHGQSTDGATFESCAIVTTEANQLMATIHNTNRRMPVIIDSTHWDEWLSADNDAALELAVPYPDGQLQAIPISTRINNPSYNRSDCLAPVEQAG